MRAYVIKTETGYIGRYDNTGYTEDATFINALLFRTKQQAAKEICGTDIIVPIDIKIARKKKG